MTRQDVATLHTSPVLHPPMIRLRGTGVCRAARAPGAALTQPAATASTGSIQRLREHSSSYGTILARCGPRNVCFCGPH
jgi:hypothetical protein